MSSPTEPTSPEADLRRIATLDRAALTPLVQQAVHSETIQVVDWAFEQVQGGIQHNTRIYRVSGTGDDQGGEVRWSLILKTTQWEPGENGDGVTYWQREALAFQSGLLNRLPVGLGVPRCFGVAAYPGKSCWIWLEDLTDRYGRQWALDHYRWVAYHLGQFNGAYLTTTPLPTFPWLSKGWLRQYVEKCAAGMEHLQQVWQHPVVKRLYSDAVIHAVFRLWSERNVYLAELDKLPQTFCHLDAFRGNLFICRGAEGQDKLVAIDWAFAGQGAVGQEPAMLVAGALGFAEVDLAQIPQLDRIVFEAYVEGLREAGWNGDREGVRFAYKISPALHFGFPFGRLDHLTAMDEAQLEAIDPTTSRSLGDELDFMAKCLRLVLDWVEEVRRSS